MNIFCIDSPYVKELEALGHKVLAPRFEPGVLYLPGLLQIHGFKPDLIIQHERLSARVLLGGMELMPCPTLFVSVDSHLNMFWHKHYGRLFDLVLTPHLSRFNALPRDEKLPQVRRFGPRGYQRMFRPHNQRRHHISFAGVLTEHRPTRSSMIQLLRDKAGMFFPGGTLPHGEMLELYTDSRMIPNEAISCEVNFRLFEAASCGCLVFSQNVGEDQNACFDPGEEFETYEHGLELLEKIAFYKKNEGLAQDMGRAAWRRVQAEHLPAHRAEELVAAARASRSRAEGDEAKACFWLSLAQLVRNGTHKLSVDWFINQERDFAASPAVTAMRLRLLCEGAQKDNPLYESNNAVRYKREAVDTVQMLLESGFGADFLDCNLAGAMAALALEHPAWARDFWRRQNDSFKKRNIVASQLKSQDLHSPYAHYMAWAKLLFSQGRSAQIGFNYQHGLGFLPCSAFECLLMAKSEPDVEEQVWLTEMHTLCAALPGFSYWDMAIMAEIAMLSPADWRLQMQYGLASLQNFRPEAGLFEISEAKKQAQLCGELSVFDTMLEDAPASGYILSALLKG